MISAKLIEDLNSRRIRLACRPSFVSPLGLVPSTMGDGTASMIYPGPLDKALTRAYRTPGQLSNT
jgi:hypothetical protein